jgi:phage terminase large subunit GpA-like protein
VTVPSTIITDPSAPESPIYSSRESFVVFLDEAARHVMMDFEDIDEVDALDPAYVERSPMLGAWLGFLIAHDVMQFQAWMNSAESDNLASLAHLMVRICDVAGVPALFEVTGENYEEYASKYPSLR